ncbi:hypothetical protein [Yinghuangia soli]|uniref:Uncharacterized protein n=1 Tax=Yinghuangia soli TaxID=2908204 RepID=A0AA41Q419_9ACTN|nr:hypothetical protein [Yinghuangia soli]MCF2530936.1 hypothetical protein [Yinghuangia soli]
MAFLSRIKTGRRVFAVAAALAVAAVAVPTAAPGAIAVPVGDVVVAGEPGGGGGTGDAWRIPASVTDNGGVSAIDSAGGTTFSVGFDSGTDAEPRFVPLATRWDGRQWASDHVQLPPGSTEARLDGIAAVGPRDAWAVGTWFVATPSGGVPRQFIAHWDGTSWQPVDADGFGPAGGLTAVSASGPDDVWAVGYGYNAAGGLKTTVRHFDGTAWSEVETGAALGDRPWDGYWVSDVAAAAPDDVWLVGVGNLTVHYDGRSWTRADAAPDRNVWLEAVRTDRVYGTWAVGFFTELGIPHTPAAFRWNGREWQAVAVPADPHVHLEDVAFTVTGPVAVGYTMNTETGYAVTLPVWPAQKAQYVETPRGATALFTAEAGPAGIGLWVGGATKSPSSEWNYASFTAWSLMPRRY